ncbi:D-2-hydroxyacid dehydrogenase [Salinicoccus carnicancri]|uniref:D-2-hydroxyacid dehydrogenase n=1 Tax=Salinicoccus carnicancri TaxID=558170 RepID=UPI00030AC362|nr:D-2-hydroxyacid dehydrogenase [Salinicoccus carnicancri]
MKNILSTTRLREDMLDQLENEFGGYEFRFVKSRDVTDSDREWADIFVTYGSDMKAEDMQAFKNLQWVMVMSAGLDDMPLSEMEGIHITNAKGIHKIQMTEYTIGLLLNFYKGIHQLNLEQERAYWRKQAVTEEIYGKTVHILGTGSIGSHLAGVLKAFGTETTGYNTKGGEVENFDQTLPVDELHAHIGEADIVINILPSTGSTRGMLNEETFRKMKDTAIFVNIGRGDIMTDDTVNAVLSEGYIRHMILDVFNQEPLPSDHKFYEYDNLTITPHASSKTPEYLTRAFDIFIYNLRRADDFNSMKNIIDNARGY